ncbi:hypothetical protein ABZ671_17125 [Micromonospora sp. NPDC006766]|uniref:hypothetical protein n=1 Tax=Micromonospora sp. NPDC006766 TaxID=3154778 RepID=UPI0033CE52B7
MTTRSVLDLIKAGEQPVTRIRVLIGESDDPERRGDKKVVAFSDCRYYCPDWATLEKCVAAIKDSDDRLRARPEELMLWDWDSTWLQLDNPTNPTEGGGTIFLGVAWYSQEFFDDRAGAWFGYMHQRIYKQIGVPLEEISVQHFLTAEKAAWKPELETATAQ